jgi:hypothetical protein
MSLQLPSILGAVASTAQFVQDLSQAQPTVPVTARVQNTVQVPVVSDTPLETGARLPIRQYDTLPLPVPKAFVILHTVDFKPADLEILKSYGRVVQYDQAVEKSMPISSLVFEYLCLDLRKKVDRSYFDSQEMTGFNVIGYISKLETFDKYIDNLPCSNIITSFPVRQHLAGDFNSLLLKQPTVSPSKCLSCITFASNYLASLKR